MSHFLLFLSETSHHATQRMAGCGDTCGVVRGDQRPTSTFSQMPLGPAQTSCSKRGSLERCPQFRRVERRHSPKRATGHRTRGARNRVSQLQTAIAAFGNHDGPEVTMLREAMKRAQRAAQEPPITNQVNECEEFIARAEKRLVLHDQQAQVEIGVRFGGWPKPIAAFARSCRGHSADAEPCASGPSRLGCSIPVSSTDGQSVAGGARRIDVCHRAESFQETSKSRGACFRHGHGGAVDARSHRCQDTVDEGAAGRVGGGHSSGSASRGVPIDSRDGGSDQSLVSEADVATFHGGERRFCVRIWDRIVQHQCGFLGCRVREASNPGPAITRQGRRLERPTQIDVSSDEDFLVLSWKQCGREKVC